MSRTERLKAKLELEQYKSAALDRILSMHNVVITKLDSVKGQLIQDWLIEHVDQSAYTYLTLDANYTGSKMERTTCFAFDNVADAVYFKLTWS